MSHAPAARMSGEELLALKFAAHRQLARWADKPRLSPDQQARHSALRGAVSVLRDPVFADGCELHPAPRGREEQG